MQRSRDVHGGRRKIEGEEGAVYSRAVRVVLNPDAVPEGENQIRAVSLSRSGTDIVLRWGLAAENGKKTRIYFKRSDNGMVTLLTQVALKAGVRNFTLAAQGLSSPCGEFHLGQVGSDDVESPLTPALFFAGIDFGIGHEGGCIDDPPTTPEPPKWADYYHVRDHLGTLRLVTDISGYVQEAHDYEPFGLELAPPGESPGTLTTRKFTGHERDASTGLDYMMARYYPASMARFLSVDPGLDNQSESPQSWNLYSYVRNNPQNWIDPREEYLEVSGPESSEYMKRLQTGSQFKLKLDSNGRVAFDGPVPGDKGLSGGQKALRDGILSKDKISISATGQDASTDFGRILSRGSQTIDMSDIQALANPGNQSKATAEGFVMHETLEAIAYAGGGSEQQAHATATKQSGIALAQPDPNRSKLLFQGFFIIGTKVNMAIYGDPAHRLIVETRFVTTQSPIAPATGQRVPKHIVKVTSEP